MRRRALFIALILCLPAVAQAAEVTLQRDGFVSNQVAGFQGGFADGERFAVKCELAPGDFPVQVLKMEFLFGGGTGTKNVLPYVWNASGTGITSLIGATTGGYPGNVVWVSPDEYQITGSNDSMHQIDVTAANVLVPSGPFWVGLQLNNGCSAGQTCFPGPARDNDGISQQHVNAIYAVDGSWYHNSVFGVNGDWILRITVLTSTGTTTDIVADSGSDTAPDTGTGNDTFAGSDTTTSSDTGTAGDTGTAPTLSITEVTPSRATQGQETLIQVRGTGFLDGMTLRLSATPLTDIVVASPQILNATVPGSLGLGIHDLIAQWPDGTLFTFPSAFEVTTDVITPTGPPPAITNVTPAQGQPGEVITVNGLNFKSGLTMELGGQPVAASAFADESGAVFTVPSGIAPGTYGITVTNPDGQSDTALNAFTVLGGTGSGDDGCGCRAVRNGEGPSGFAVLAVLAALGFLALRRRSA